MVHYTTEGSRMIAAEVVRVIDRQKKAAQEAIVDFFEGKSVLVK